MAKIKPKLNLNKTPQAVENYSLVMAHNIAIDEEGCIIPDYSMETLLEYDKESSSNPNNVIAIIPGLDSHIYIFKYEFVAGVKVYKIVEYDELTKQQHDVDCNWTYSGGTITGNVTVNNTNEYILNICESDASVDVPIKHINLSKCSSSDDESIYTQNPNIPITNLSLIKTYTKNIPNGVYQFFVRYKIRDEFYTGWFPCSKECFAGVSQVIRTVQGQIKYVKTDIDSAKAFIFNVEHLFDNYKKLYQEYQIGFILSTNDSMVARSWKSFDFNETQIKFDYDQNAIEEINIEDILTTNYELFNVKNIAYFRDKQYISNYKETDFNPTLANDGITDIPAIAKNIGVTLLQHPFNTTTGCHIDGKALSDSATTTGGVTYYKKWGSNTDAKQIFVNKNLINKNRSEYSYGSAIDSSTKNNGLYEYKLECDFTVNPDLMWIKKGWNHNNVPNFPLANFDFGDGNYFGTGKNWHLFNHSGGKHTSVTAGTWALLQREYSTQHAWDNVPAYKRKWFALSNDNGSFSVPNGNGDSYICQDKGFGGHESDISKYTINTIKTNFGDDTNLGKCKIVGAYILQGTTKYFIYGSASTIDTSQSGQHLNDPYDFTGMAVDSKDEVNDVIIEQLLYNKILGITDTGTFVARFTQSGVTTDVEFDKFFIVYSEFEYYCSNPTSGQTVSDVFTHDIRIDVKRKNYSIEKSCLIDSRYISLTGTTDEKQYNTLLPFTEYEFYVHFVKQNGIITNGYIINNGNGVILNKDTSYPYGKFTGTNYNCVIYPKFTNIVIPNGYVSCFFSIYKTGHDICKCFNHELRSDGYHYVDCLEADTLLYNLKNKIVIIDSEGRELTSGGSSASDLVQSVNADYYSSSDFTPVEMLGNSGCIRWKRNAVTDAILYGNISGGTTVTVPNEGGVLALYINGGDNGIGESFATFTIPANTDISSAYVTTIRNTLWQIYDIPERIHYCSFELGKPGSTQRDIKFIFNTRAYTNTTITGSTITENKIVSIGFALAATEDLAKELAKRGSTNATIPIVGDELWVKINNTYSKNKDRQLIKLTPYIDVANLKIESNINYYDNYEDLNSPGYLCKVYKPNRNYSNNIYVSGTDIYEKDTTTPNIIKLEQYYNYIDLNTSNSAYILSNFNLNYVSLNENINPQIRNFKLDPDGTSYDQVIKALNSLTASFILKLESMYKKYLRKYYYVYDPNKLTVFDNTLRSSDVNTDEVYRNIYKFYPNDYYNVPVNRGKIIFMFAVLNEIYVHCEHSLFKFAGNNTLTANEGEISLKESNVFDTGVTEIFDSQHGFAGLNKRHHGIVTFTAYIFYDQLHNKIYSYDPSKGLKVLSDPISKILNNYQIEDVVFAEDSFHNRLFINFICTQTPIKDTINISYNFATESFISIHDFTFRFAANTRLYTYFVNDTWMNANYKDYIIRLNKYLQVCSGNQIPEDIDQTYQKLYKLSALGVNRLPNYLSEGIIASCVDIICNIEYEKIKVFNEVSWICNYGLGYSDTDGKNHVDDKKIAYPGNEFMIYTDQTYSDFIISSQGVNWSNNYPLTALDSFKDVRYNNGIFTANFFRNGASPHMADTDKALIHGKYFVFRIIFHDRRYRLENVTINFENYEKA